MHEMNEPLQVHSTRMGAVPRIRGTLVRTTRDPVNTSTQCTLMLWNYKRTVYQYFWSNRVKLKNYLYWRLN